MNAESLVDNGFGLIREIERTKCREVSVFSLPKKMAMLNA